MPNRGCAYSKTEMPTNQTSEENGKTCGYCQEGNTKIAERELGRISSCFLLFSSSLLVLLRFR